MDAEKQQRIQTLITEVIQKFVTEFASAYTQNLIAECEEEVAGPDEPPPDYHLESAPIPSSIIKEGKMFKEGGFIHNWKERHFVVYNQVDNYRVDYHDGKNGEKLGKKKGEVNCCGYTPRAFNEEETTKYGANGFKLDGGPRRREWRFRCATEEERDEWIKTFSDICWKARPQRNPDDKVAGAFVTAYWTTRWWFSLWGSYTPYGTEDERLCDLIMSILDREVLYDVYASLPGAGAVRALAESTIRNPIEQSVKAAVGGSWTTAVNAAKGGADKLKETVLAIVTPLIEQKKAMKDKIVESVGSMVNGVLAEKASESLSPAIAYVLNPVCSCFALTINEFTRKAKELAERGDLTVADLHGDDGPFWWYQKYWMVSDNDSELRQQTYNNLPMAALLEVLQGPSAWSLYYTLRDSMLDICMNASYTLGKAVRDAPDASVPEKIAMVEAVRVKYIHDAKLAVRVILVNVLRQILDYPVQSLMIKPAETMVAPIQEAIDAIPVPGLPALLNLKDMTTSSIERIIRNFLNILVEGGLETAIQTNLVTKLA